MNTPNLARALDGSVALVLGVILLSAAVGCSPKVQSRRELSLGTNGTLVAAFDSQGRVHGLRHYNPDRSLKLSVDITYGKRDMQRLTVFEPRGHQVWETRYTSSSEIHGGRGSDVPSPGWEIRAESHSSGTPGDIHDTRSWYCGDDLLFRVHRTWPDDKGRVHYVVTGPSGVILFTNTYAK